jgi:hypothetical protein
MDLEGDDSTGNKTQSNIMFRNAEENHAKTRGMRSG